MPKEIGLNREQITFKCTKATLTKIDSYIGTGEYTSRNEVIRDALKFFFENQGKPNEQERFKTWIKSGEGKAFIKDILREADGKLNDE